MKKVVFIFLIISLIFVACLPSFGQASVKVNLDGKPFEGKIVVRNGTTFVDVCRFAEQTDQNAFLYYQRETKCLYIKTSGLFFMCEVGRNYVIANERYIYNAEAVFESGGVVYAPIMQIYRAFNSSIRWSDSFGGFYVKSGDLPLESGSSYYREDAVYWLSRIINAEARGEEMEGKIAVGNVVLNRVRSKEFPNTIYGVIFDRKYGVQFTPVATETINQKPSTESVIAAKICLEYYSVSPDILYFVNPTLAPDSWASRNRELFRKIGNHEFYF